MLAIARTKGQTFDQFVTAAWGLEVKYDGHRMQVHVVTAGDVIAWARRSASAKDQTPLRRDLPAPLVAALRTLPEGWYDGELIVPGGTSSDVTRLDCQDKLRMVLFDMLEATVGGQTEVLKAKPYTERRAYLTLAIAHYTAHDPTGELVRLSEVLPVSDDSVQAIWDRGGEGAIIKRLAAPYQAGKRSQDWLKVKRGGSATLAIVGFEAGKSGPCSVVLLEGQHLGHHTDARVKVPFAADRDAMAANPDAWIGRRLVVSYTELTATGSLRHGHWDHLASKGE